MTESPRPVQDPGFLSAGECLKDARKATGWSVKQLSRASGVSDAAIFALEKGGPRGPGDFTVMVIADALRVRVSTWRCRWYWDIDESEDKE